MNENLSSKISTSTTNVILPKQSFPQTSSQVTVGTSQNSQLIMQQQMPSYSPVSTQQAMVPLSIRPQTPGKTKATTAPPKKSLTPKNNNVRRPSRPQSSESKGRQKLENNRKLAPSIDAHANKKSADFSQTVGPFKAANLLEIGHSASHNLMLPSKKRNNEGSIGGSTQFLRQNTSEGKVSVHPSKTSTLAQRLETQLQNHDKVSKDGASMGSCSLAI